MLNHSNNKGFTLTEMLLVTTIVTGGGAGVYTNAKNKAYEVACQSNLKQFNTALELFIMDNGTLPSAKFFPEKPDEDTKSIKVILKAQGVPGEIFVCPSASDDLKKIGLTYIWNDELNGKSPDTLPDAGKTWLMVDMNAVTEKVSPAHRDGYNVLYADGTAGWSNTIRDEISKEKKAQLMMILARLKKGQRPFFY